MKKIEELPDEYALKLIKDKWAVECPEEDPGPEGVDELIEEVEDDAEEEIVEAEEEEEEEEIEDEEDIFRDEDEEDILSDEEVEIEVDGFEESE